MIEFSMHTEKEYVREKDSSLVLVPDMLSFFIQGCMLIEKNSLLEENQHAEERRGHNPSSGRISFLCAWNVLD